MSSEVFTATILLMSATHVQHNKSSIEIKDNFQSRFPIHILMTRYKHYGVNHLNTLYKI